MNTFKKKSLYAALAGIGALGATGAAQAVNVNPDGLGQVLIYPYYTVRDYVAGAAYNSLLSVVNSTASAKAVKVRFLEGKNSREVLDFNLYLSAKDVWTVAILPSGVGAGIATFDKSCTTPKVSSDPTNPSLFVNFAFTGSAADGADTSLDRTREGYVEIIEMGNIVGGSTTEGAVTHSAGVPSCSPLGNTQASTDTVAGNGGLFGGMTLINVLAGTDFAIDAVALDAFSATALWRIPGSTAPSLADVNPPESVVTTGTTTYLSFWTSPIDAVSAILMHDHVYNEFVLDAATKSGTDWVVTMPTKNQYVLTGSGSAPKLFQRNFNGNSGSCDDVAVVQYDREERAVTSPGTFSPPPPTFTDALCWEANVITFNNSNVFASKNVSNIPSTFQNGWVDLSFIAPTPKHELVSTNTTVINVGGATPAQTRTYHGLPVVGFAAQTYNNGTLPGVGPGLVQSVYGGAFIHKTTRLILP